VDRQRGLEKDRWTLEEIADAFGVSYRQVFHWVAEKRLLEGNYYSARGEYLGTSPQRSGSRILLSAQQARALSLMALLVKAGMLPTAAAPVARELAVSATLQVDLGPGLRLSLVPEEAQPAEPEPAESPVVRCWECGRPGARCLPSGAWGCLECYPEPEEAWEPVEAEIFCDHVVEGDWHVWDVEQGCPPIEPVALSGEEGYAPGRADEERTT
jgi:hypothetical protein